LVSIIKLLDFINLNKIKGLQLEAIDSINSLFIKDYLSQLKFEYDFFEGVRGEFEDKLNSCVSILFIYSEFTFNIHLYYDQLEYYIKKGDKNIKSCILEDYTDDYKEMSLTFRKYLEKDMLDLNIVANYIQINNKKLNPFDKIKKIIFG
jgi:hypothetical protein